MMIGERGYISDIGYSAGFYPETAPGHLAFAACLSGQRTVSRPARVLDLGFGQGFGMALLAAANPDIDFEGYDFNAEHVAHARFLAEGAGLANLAPAQASFEGLADRGGDNDIDIIILHGVFSWVSPAVQDAIVRIVRQRLRPRGIVYVSYNAMPGWSPLLPIRRLMTEVGRAGEGGSARRLEQAMEAMRILRQRNAAYFVANPAAARHMDMLQSMDPAYLSHEYLAEDAAPLYFTDVANSLGEEFSFIASATLTENFADDFWPSAARSLDMPTNDVALRETVRDFLLNKSFRRDIFVRASDLAAVDADQACLSRFAFVLAVPRERVLLRLPGPSGEIAARPDRVGPIVDELARGPAEFGTLAALPPFHGCSAGILVETLALLAQSGQVLPCLPSPRQDAEPARRFNRFVVEQARAGRVYGHLAVPAGGTGMPVSDFGLLALSAAFEGAAIDAQAAARHGLEILKRLGRTPLRHGQPVTDDREAAAFLAEHLQPMIEEMLPVWRNLSAI